VTGLILVVEGPGGWRGQVKARKERGGYGKISGPAGTRAQAVPLKQEGATKEDEEEGVAGRNVLRGRRCSGGPDAPRRDRRGALLGRGGGRRVRKDGTLRLEKKGVLKRSHTFTITKPFASGAVRRGERDVENLGDQGFKQRETQISQKR